MQACFYESQPGGEESDLDILRRRRRINPHRIFFAKWAVKKGTSFTLTEFTVEVSSDKVL